MSYLSIIKIIVLSLFLILSEQSGVMQITLNNIKNVLHSYQQLYILFHNPQCIHSRKYSQSFIKLTTQTQNNLGIVDCLRELQLCKSMNLTHYPILVKMDVHQNKQNNQNNQNNKQLFKISNTQFQSQIIDQQQFLIQNKAKDINQQLVNLNKFVSLLENQPNYAIVVFQDQGLPCPKNDKLIQNQKILYLQPSSLTNPSNFTKTLSSLVGNKFGCWIFSKNKQNQLQKYYCEDGYNKESIKKYIKMFEQKKLKKYIVSQQTKESSDKKTPYKTDLNSQQLYEKFPLIQSKKLKTCHLIYFYSSNCVHCSPKDFIRLQKIYQKLDLINEIQLQKYNIDLNEIPQQLIKIGFDRVPQILYICQKQNKYKLKLFKEILTLKNMEEFIRKEHLQVVEQQQNYIQEHQQNQFEEKIEQNDQLL